MKKLYSILVLLLLLHGANAQRMISGSVKDTKGDPTIGASVSVRGETAGTITDIDGRYKLSVGADAKSMIITFTGYEEQEVAIGASDIIDVILGEGTLLDELVVTALGIQRNKNDLAYSAQKVSSEDITRTRDNNVLNSLSGKVAGLTIKRNNNLGGSTNIVLRGTKSLTGDNQALFVVDGVPIDNVNNNTGAVKRGFGGYDFGSAASDINPDDIENVTVLKGAAASALYGSRASNGVIQITTKKGRKSKGIGVTINIGANAGSYDPSTFIKYQKTYGAGYGDYYYDSDDDTDGGFYNFDLDGDGKNDKIVTYTEDASYGAKFDPSLNVFHWDAFDPSSPNYKKAKPWVAAQNGPESFFENSFGTSNGVVIDGAMGEGGFFKLGYTRTTDKGILPGSQINKDLVNFGAGYELTKNLKAFSNINFTNQNAKGRYGSGYSTQNLMTNFRQWWQTNVDVADQKSAYLRNKKNTTWNWADDTGTHPIYWDNPYWTRNENYETDARGRLFGNAGLEYKVNNWLSAKGQISIDKYSEYQDERIAVGSLDVSKYSRFDQDFQELNFDGLLTTKKFSLSNKLGFSALLGSNIRKNSRYVIRDETNGGLIIPGLYSLSNSANPRNAPSESETKLQVNGLFAGTSFDLDNTLFLDMTLRRDQASSLPLSKNSYYYPSASLGFIFSNLIRENNNITFGKLRMNYAEVGNTAPPLSLNETFVIGVPTASGAYATSFDGVPLASISNTKNNTSLKPEKSQALEFGFEARFLKDRVGIDATYYNMNSIDQIIAAPVSSTTGYEFKYINAGKINNKGIELQLFFRPFTTSKFDWRTEINYARNRNLVVDLGEIDNLLLGSISTSVNATVGQPYGTLRADGFKLNDKGEKIVGENGFYEREENKVIGNINPDWTGGINNIFKMGPVNFSFLIDIKKGGDVWSLDRYYGLATGLTEETTALNDLGNPLRDPLTDDAKSGGLIMPGVLADGTVNTIRVDASNSGVQGYIGMPSEAFVYDASFVKLREVNLGFDLPKSILGSTFKGASLNLYGRNLWIISKNLPYSDPEEGFSSGNIQGLQGGAYPTTRVVGVNLNFKF
jgi:TonB-linked SusC/RagA family outer membrane protein